MVKGYIRCGKYEDDTFNSVNNKEFTCKDKNGNEHIMESKEIHDWALLLNSPWSQADERYEIEVNCKDAYTEMDNDAPTWRCKYYTIGYEGICAACIGYGNTEEEALKDCKELLSYLQHTYNPDDDCC